MSEEEIIKNIKIEDVVSEFVVLRKSGLNLKGNSPFVNEKTASFYVVPSKQIFKCFNTGYSGNAIDFLMYLKRCNHSEAIQFVVEKFGLNSSKSKSDSDFGENSYLFHVRPILEQFKSSSDEIVELLKFDELIIVYCKKLLEDANQKLKYFLNIDNPLYRLDNHILQLEQIKNNESLKDQYQTMYNQCLSLLVMNFTSSVKALFVNSINHFAEYSPSTLSPKKHSIKLSFEDLRSNQFDIRKNLGQLCADISNISFQDMASTLRAFNDFFEIEIERNALINDLIVTQASRHCIVHTSALADIKFLTQIRDCNPRRLKTKIELGESISYNPEEILQLIEMMKEFIALIVKEINSKLSIVRS